MIVLLIALICLCLWGLSFSNRNDYNNYISKERTNSIKGIFILLIFLSHINGYIKNSGYAYDVWGDNIYLAVLRALGQLVVVMFLFYSGYGVMESITHKGKDYTTRMPRHRILNTLLNFDVAVCFFVLADFIIGQDVTLPQFVLSLFAWDTVGNSNWYIFIILVCYTATWLIGSFSSNRKLMWVSTFILLTIVAILLYFVKEPYWYNTLWAYPTGMLYSTYKQRIEKFLGDHYLSSLSVLFLLFVVVYCLPVGLHGFRMNTLSILFSLLMVVLTLRVKIDNVALRWCGENLFPLYIYQRIPMLVLFTLFPSWVAGYPLAYIVLCLLVALLITYLYKYVRIKL